MSGFELTPGQKWAIGISVSAVAIGIILIFLWMSCYIPSIGKPLARCSKASKSPLSPMSQTPTPTCGVMADTCQGGDTLPCCKPLTCVENPFTLTKACMPDASDGPCLTEGLGCTKPGTSASPTANCCSGLTCSQNDSGNSTCTQICIEDGDECGTPQIFQCCNSNSKCADTGLCTPST